MVAVYAVLHDQYIVRICPEHFTLYHEPMWGLSDPAQLAAAWAFNASFSPGLALGLACAFVARNGTWPKISPVTVYKGVLVVIVVAEMCSMLSGWWVYQSQEPLLPRWVYPSDDPNLLITATIQWVCYLTSGLGSGCLLLWILKVRRKNFKIS